MNNEFKNGLKKDNFMSKVEPVELFPEEQKKLLIKGRKKIEGIDSEIGDDMETTIDSAILKESHNMSHLISLEKMDNLFKSIVLGEKTEHDEGGRE